MNEIQLPKPDKRYGNGKIGKDSKGTFKGHPETVELKRMSIPANSLLHIQLNPPLIATAELAKFLATQQSKEGGEE